VSGRNQPTNKNSSANKGGWEVQWVNHYWSDEDDKSYLEWLKSGAGDEWEMFDHLIDTGYKISFGVDNRAAFRCTITMPSGLKHVHSGYGFSAFSTNTQDAFLIAVYKVLVIYLAGVEEKSVYNGERKRG